MKETWTLATKEVTNTLSITYHEATIKCSHSTHWTHYTLPLSLSLSLSLSLLHCVKTTLTYAHCWHTNWSIDCNQFRWHTYESIIWEEEEEKKKKRGRSKLTQRALSNLFDQVSSFASNESSSLPLKLPCLCSLCDARGAEETGERKRRKRRRTGGEDTLLLLLLLLLLVEIIYLFTLHKSGHVQAIERTIRGCMSLILSGGSSSSSRASGGCFHFPYLFILAFKQFPFSILLPKKQAIFQASVISLCLVPCCFRCSKWSL